MRYQQFAAVQKAAGHDPIARAVLIEQQRDRRKSGEVGGWLRNTSHAIWGFLAGYGYRPIGLAVMLAVILALAGTLGVIAGHVTSSPGHFIASHTQASGRLGSPCSTLEQIGLGVDRGLPIGSIGVRTYCDLNTGTFRGELFTAGLWIVEILIWSLATLIVVGYTSLIRKLN
jgi:hypothetical protein